MKYLLDTNTLSFLMAGDESVTERLLALGRTEILVPQPVIAEIRYGLARMPPSKRKTRLQGRFELFLGEFQRAPWTDAVSQAFGQAKADLEKRGTPLEDFDVAVAAPRSGTRRDPRDRQRRAHDETPRSPSRKLEGSALGLTAVL